MHIRLGYVSQVTNAGRSLDIDQFGISPGLTFYHHTGLFADLSGFFNSDYDPSYYITKATAGYFYTYKELLTSTISHDFYFFNDSLGTHSFDKSIQLSSFLDYKFFNLGVDYSYLYGNKTAHRLTGAIGLDFKFSKVWIFDRIALYPGFSIQYGNADVVFIRQSEEPFRDLYGIMTEGNYPELSNREFYQLGTLLKNERELLATKYLIDRGFTIEQIAGISDAYYENQIRDENVYGIMNYAFSLPVALTINPKLSVILGYTYNVPVRLPNEPYALDHNGFFNLSVAYKLYYIK